MKKMEFSKATHNIQNKAGGGKEQNVNMEVESNYTQSKSETEETGYDNVYEDDAFMNNSGENAADGAVIIEEDDVEQYKTMPDDEHDKEDYDDIIDKNDTDRKHPYSHLLNNYTVDESNLKIIENIKVIPLSNAQYIFITTRTMLTNLIEQLSFENQIGVVAMFNQQYYHPSLCVLGISTRTIDYIIDYFKIEDDLHLLSEIFGNPKIIKIIYGQEILRKLQLYHNLFFVNIFDTGRAMRTLRWSFSSIRKYVAIKFKVFDKKLEQWDLRPLSERHIHSLLIDGHFLIPTYLSLNNYLIKEKKIIPFLLMENEHCKALFTEKNHVGLLRELPNLSANRVYAFHAIEDWKQTMAQKKNTSANQILSWISIRRLVKKMPIKKKDVLKICPSRIAIDHVNEIIDIIRRAETGMEPINSKPNGEGEKIKSHKSNIDKKSKQINKYEKYWRLKGSKKQGEKSGSKQQPGFKKRPMYTHDKKGDADRIPEDGPVTKTENEKFDGNQTNYINEKNKFKPHGKDIYITANSARDINYQRTAVSDTPVSDPRNLRQVPSQTSYASSNNLGNSTSLHFYRSNCNSCPQMNKFSNFGNSSRFDSPSSSSSGAIENLTSGFTENRRSSTTRDFFAGMKIDFNRSTR